MPVPALSTEVGSGTTCDECKEVAADRTGILEWRQRFRTSPPTTSVRHNPDLDSASEIPSEDELARVVDNRGIPVSGVGLLDAGAVALAHDLWRNTDTVEGWHSSTSGFNDGDDQALAINLRPQPGAMASDQQRTDIRLGLQGSF